MNTYNIKGLHMDSVDLKCMLIGRGVKVDKTVYKYAKNTMRLNINPLCCNCMLLSDGTIVQLTDTQFHLQYLSGILSWDNIKLLRHVKDLATPFTLRMENGQVILYCENAEVDIISFPPLSHFYKQKTASGRPFMGNAVMQGLDWVAFQCLWPCEFAADRQACQFCFSGGDFENAAKKGKALPKPITSEDVKEIIAYSLDKEKISNIQITGGSTYDGKSETKYITAHLAAIKDLPVPGETLLYITPPSDTTLADQYFELGASRIACSLEIWNMTLAREITPGKVNFIGRERYLQTLEYIAKKYGNGKAFSNFIIGLESFDDLAKGSTYLAERGILPTASVWMPMGRPVMGSMKAPALDYYKQVKEHFAELYTKFKLEPPKSHGLNVCVEWDIWNYTQ